MIPYILLFSFASFLYFIPSDRKSEIGYYLFLIVTILFSGLRDMIGGYDVYIYAEVYESAIKQMIEFSAFEIGFRWLYYFLRLFSENRFFMFFVCALIIMSTHFYSVKKNSNLVYFSLFILFCKFFLMSFVYLRQGIAMGIVWLSISYILKRDFKRFILILLLAFLIHKSSIIFLPIYFIATKKLNQLNMFVIAIAALIISITPLMSYFMTFISESVDNEKVKVYVSKSGGINLFYLLESLLLIYLILKFSVQFYLSNKGIMILNGLYLYVLINIIALTNASFIRFGWYYFIFLVLALPQIFYFIKQLEIRKLFKAGIYLYYSLLFFRLLIVYDDGDFMPYKTIFQDFDRNSQWEFMDNR